MKLLKRSDKDKITFKAIEKYQYGLWKIVSKYLKNAKKQKKKFERFFSQAYDYKGLILFFPDTVCKWKISTTHFFPVNNK